MYKPIKMTYQ